MRFTNQVVVLVVMSGVSSVRRGPHPSVLGQYGRGVSGGSGSGSGTASSERGGSGGAGKNFTAFTGLNLTVAGGGGGANSGNSVQSNGGSGGGGMGGSRAGR